jgi:hypothetical protein
MSVSLQKQERAQKGEEGRGREGEGEGEKRGEKAPGRENPPGVLERREREVMGGRQSLYTQRSSRARASSAG